MKQAASVEHGEGEQGHLGEGRALSSHEQQIASAVGAATEGVSVHTGPRAAAYAAQVGARGFAIGTRIGFAGGAYHPGTLGGDALIAHELAHVGQQSGAVEADGGAGEHAAERDADQAAVAGVATMWPQVRSRLGPSSRSAGPRLRSGLQLRRCIDKQSSTPLPEAASTPAQLTQAMGPQLEPLSERLSGMDKQYAAFRDYRMIDARLGRYKYEKGQALEKDLAEYGFASIVEFDESLRRFLSMFRSYALSTAYAMLDENEKLVASESGRYTDDLIGQFRRDLKPFDPMLDQMVALDHEIAGYLQLAGSTIVPEPYYRKIDKLRAERETKRAGIAAVLAPKYPILADPEFSPEGARAVSDDELRKHVGNVIRSRIENIGDTRRRLNAEPEKVWELESVIARARVGMRIVPGTIFDAIISNKIKDYGSDRAFFKLFLAAIAIGVAVLTGGAATPVVVAALGAATVAGIGVYQASESVREFRFKQAAAGTAFDRAKALTQDVPSPIWLALDIAGAVLDLALAAKVLAKLAGSVIKAVNELRAGAEAAESAAKLEALKKDVETVLQAEGKLEPEAARVAAERIVDDAASQSKATEALASKAAAEIRAVLPQLDEASVVALTRLTDKTRAALLASLRAQPGILTRVAELAAESPDVLKTLELLHNAVGPERAARIIAKYAGSPTSFPMLRAIGQANLSEEALRALTLTASGKTRSIGSFVRDFPAGVQKAIAESIGGGADGYRRILEITEGLHPNQSAQIFEKWAAKNFYAQGKLGRWTGTVNGQKVFTDESVAGQAGETILEFKHYRETGAFGSDAQAQARNYQSLIANGVAGNSGKPFVAVEYLFSTQAAANANVDFIKGLLGEASKVYYVDALGARVLLR